VHDLHDLVWEWVLDFNAPMLGSDARDAGDAERMRFCGAGALTASDKEDYASYMRLAMRSSLRASYTTGSLGFRCAMDAERKEGSR
jgi:formylglycine-generating enzyme required for sulfatase activity